MSKRTMTVETIQADGVEGTKLASSDGRDLILASEALAESDPRTQLAALMVTNPESFPILEDDHRVYQLVPEYGGRVAITGKEIKAKVLGALGKSMGKHFDRQIQNEANKRRNAAVAGE